MGYDIFNNADQLLGYYKIQADDFRMRHTAIWTEVQHYTWVLSILLGAGPIAAVGQPTLNKMQSSLLLFLPLLGVAVAFLAFLIIRRDFVYYTQADSRLLYIEKKLGVLEEINYIDARTQRARQESFTVATDVIEQTKIGLRSLISLRIRALILFTFALYVFAGVCEVVYFAALLFA